MPVGRGDVTVEDLLVHGSWVRALARSLASDVHAADDAEQQAWVAALTRPPPRAENLRAWFARVVRRRLSDRRRSEGRRAHAETAARRTADVRPPEELVVRAETQLAVAREVLALAEPYRTTVLLRFFE